MSVFYCEACRKTEDADEVGCIETGDGGLVCQDAQDDLVARQEWAAMSPRERRYELGEDDADA